MSSGYGLCGNIPADANVTTEGGQPLLGQKGLGACPGQYNLADKCCPCVLAMLAFVRYITLDTGHIVDSLLACSVCVLILSTASLER